MPNAALQKPPAIAERLLAWYEANARALPWRVGPREREEGVRPDPYAVWLSEIMLQQTTVAAVAPRFSRFLARWPDAAALAAAPSDAVMGEWAGLGYYARARNLVKAARAVAEDHGGVFPSTEEGLRALPGVGAYTAAAIAAIAFDAPAVVVDGNVERVVARLFAVETPLPAAKAELRRLAGLLTPQARPGDHAQAMMDLGATICAPRAPRCADCPLNDECAGSASGAPETYPRKAAKAAKPTRRGAAFALFDNSGRVLLVRRDEKGLLGGMLALPCGPWTEETAADPLVHAPAKARWTNAGAVRHAFTHFQLDLDVYVATARRRPKSDWPEGEWTDPDAARLPTVMKKALERALAARERGGACSG